MRFRNTLDDSKDAVYVFLATGVGLAAAVDIPVATVISVLFNVTVLDVHTLVVRGKQKRLGRFIGRRPAIKKAIVTLKAGENIEFFEGV